jgi:hypothetical protein
MGLDGPVRVLVRTYSAEARYAADLEYTFYRLLVVGLWPPSPHKTATLKAIEVRIRQEERGEVHNPAAYSYGIRANRL